ncbi:MAG: peptide chain release factor 1 [Candidatus Falkowbacteria bacterium]|nr:peptide chain release factor 1 [Candidatus Falkowbacteria bacterium]
MDKYQEIKTKYDDFTNQLNDLDNVNNPKKLTDISRNQAEIKEAYRLIVTIEKIEKEISENKEIIEVEKDSELAEIAKEELVGLEAKKIDLEGELNSELRPKDPRDKKNCIVEIRAGTGGDESALFAVELFKMYLRYAENKGWKINILTSSTTGIGGYKEIIFEVKGENVFGDLKYESGTHRVQRVPETEKQGRIHTSTTTVIVLPEAEEVDLEIKAEDYRIDTFCSSGPGGQSVNTTYSAIRITHFKSGLVVSCQDQKSQHQNKEKALQILRSRLLAQEEEKKRKEASDIRLLQVGAGDRSDKVRTYNYPQDRITDHRISQSWHGIAKILDGGVSEIIEELKKAEIV